MSKLYDKMRPLQKDAADSMRGKEVGKIILPTGTGKSWIQADVIIDTVMEAQKNGELSVCLTGSHRLLLNEQNALNTIKYLEEDLEQDRNVGYNVLSIGSNGISDKDVAEEVDERSYDLDEFCSVCRTTKPAVIKKFIERTKNEKRHLLIISTYHSIHRVPSSLEIDVACFDEAHTTTEEDKYNNLLKVLKHTKRRFFFTATEIIGKNGRGMDNLDTFGETLNGKGEGVPPRMAIDHGDILPPLLDVLEKSGGKKRSLLDSIQAAFLGHRGRVLSTSMTAMETLGEKGSSKIGPKLLISATGVEEIIAVMTNRSFLSWAHKKGIILISFSSGQGCYLSDLSRAHNFPDDTSDLKVELKVSRKEAMAALKGLTHEQSAIIFHYDILTEGIDLPTITGVMPLRELDAVKFQQTCGRAARLFGEDRKRIYSLPQDDPNNPKSFITDDSQVSVSGILYKPVFWVIADPDLEDLESEAHERMLASIRDSYQVLAQPKDVVDRSTSSTPAFLDPVTPLELPDLTDAEKEVANFSHVYEMIIFRGSLPEDKLRYIEEMVTEMEGMSWEEIQDHIEGIYGESPEAVLEDISEEPSQEEVALDKETPRVEPPQETATIEEESPLSEEDKQLMELEERERELEKLAKKLEIEEKKKALADREKDLKKRAARLREVDSGTEGHNKEAPTGGVEPERARRSTGTAGRGTLPGGESGREDNPSTHGTESKREETSTGSKKPLFKRIFPSFFQ